MPRKSKLKKKYRAKTEHLAKIRKDEEEEKWRNRSIPIEIEEYKGCAIFDKGKIKNLKPAEVSSLVIGKIEIDEDEKAVLRLNPKFAVMSRLRDEEMETEAEVGISKLRY